MRELTFEQKYLLTLMGYALKGKRLKSVPEGVELNWAALVREAQVQSVSMLLFDVISDLKGQLDAYEWSFRHARRYTAGNIRMEFAQTELVSLLESKGYPYVILKGQTAAAYYPRPELRLLGDVDFLVPESLTCQVAEDMQALDYTLSEEPEDHHQLLEKNGARLELHMQIAGMPKGQAKAPVEAFLEDIYERSVPVTEEKFQAPCPAHHGLILLLHMQHHVVSRGMGLRHIMDWACFVDRTAQEPFWREQLLPLLKAIGLYRLASVFTKMCWMYLDTFCPSWAADADPKICEALMQDILSAGNFGWKDEDRSRSINMIPDWEQGKKESRLCLLWKTLRESALKRYPKLENRPVVLLLAMAGRSIRYVALFCVGKRPNLLKAAGHAEQRRSVYEQLRMFEPDA